MGEDTDPLLEATMAVLPPLLTALDALEHTGRHMHPPHIAELAAIVAPFDAPLRGGRERFLATDWPAHLAGFRTCVDESSEQALTALDKLRAAPGAANPTLAAYAAMGATGRAVAALYPVAFMLPPVNRYFIAAPLREDEALLARLADADPAAPQAGVIHARNAADQRGGFSLYVPEYYDKNTAYPLVVALHGGSGHGRSFLWTWLRDARSRGVIVLTPTSLDGTWGLHEPGPDAGRLDALVAEVGQQWHVDPQRVLLTGMSDGGTFSYLAGLRDGAPFTHVAPISASFHPLLLEGVARERLQGLPVYLVHGALDWMFPVDVAHMARDALRAAGAELEYRELDDLSHTYPREENQRILDWFLGQRPTGSQPAG